MSLATYLGWFGIFQLGYFFVFLVELNEKYEFANEDDVARSNFDHDEIVKLLYIVISFIVTSVLAILFFGIGI